MKRAHLIVLLGTALALIAAFVAWSSWWITVAIDSEPTGARVRIDGRLVAETPASLSLAAGRHRIELEHSHYETAVLTLDLARGDHIERTVGLAAGMGELSLLSNPRGAWVELNGTRLEGITPLVVQAPSGPTTVRMGDTERRPEEEEVIVLADQSIEVNLDLERDPHGALTVAVSPASASVRLRDLDIAYRPGVRVPIGEHRIEVSRRGYEAQRLSVNVRRGDNRTSVTLSRGLGALTVRVQPREAIVTISRKDGSDRERTTAYTQGMRVPTGSIEIRARALGHRTRYREIELGTDGASIDLVLEPMQVVSGSTFDDPLADGGTAPRMIVIPPGTFVMGNPDGPPSVRPARRRTLSQPFAVSINEVTTADFMRFVRATGHDADARLTASDEPVRYVAWDEAVAYADWLTQQTGHRYRLPTEAEWEYMARAGATNAEPFDTDDQSICAIANLADASTRTRYRDWDVADCDDGFATIAPVGALLPNAFGVHDAQGNVAEWVLECGLPDYDSAPDDGADVALGPSCSAHGVRGGSWDDRPDALRIERRIRASGRGDDRGIRLVKEL